MIGLRVKRVARAERKWDWRDYLVVILCLSGALFFVRLFWLDLNQAFARLSEGAVGTATRKYNVVQRRFINHTLMLPWVRRIPVLSSEVKTWTKPFSPISMLTPSMKRIVISD
ncbi:hypothetical protein AGMMS49944_04270 [Spirochaetia bacterium]|nr:hypothetical protein AGMMS49944_04270 [Spirochaetia bacterium]